MKSLFLAAGLPVLVVFLAIGCLGPRLQQGVTPTLYLSEPAIDGGQGHLLISVADMPDGGLAAIHLDLGGLLYDEEKVSAIATEGLNGFVVLVSQFADGDGGFILANLTGVETGPILRLTFNAHGNIEYGDIRLLAEHITLVSDALAMIENWKTPAYYAQ